MSPGAGARATGKRMPDPTFSKRGNAVLSHTRQSAFQAIVILQDYCLRCGFERGCRCSLKARKGTNVPCVVHHCDGYEIQAL